MSFQGKRLKSWIFAWFYCIAFCYSYCQILQRWICPHGNREIGHKHLTTLSEYLGQEMWERQATGILQKTHFSWNSGRCFFQDLKYFLRVANYFQSIQTTGILSYLAAVNSIPGRLPTVTGRQMLTPEASIPLFQENFWKKQHEDFTWFVMLRIFKLGLLRDKGLQILFFTVESQCEIQCEWPWPPKTKIYSQLDFTSLKLSVGTQLWNNGKLCSIDISSGYRHLSLWK